MSIQRKVRLAVDLEIMAYASHIGIQLPEEGYLIDLAKEGINVSLPKDWKVYMAPD